MSAVVERVGHQPVPAEPLSDVIVAAGVLPQPVRKDDHRTRCDVGGPDVVDDAHAGDAVEGVFATGGCHQGQRRPNRPARRGPIGPPFGLVAMAWRDEEAVDAWLRRVTPRLTGAEITGHRRVLAEIRDRGYGAWRFDAAHTSLHDRLTAVLASLEPTAQVTRELSTLMTMVTLQSVTHVLETKLTSTEFVVLPIFDRDGQPEYQIEIHLGGRDDLSLPDLDAALGHAQTLLYPDPPWDA